MESAPMYDIYPPAISLRPFIECFWFLCTDGATPAPLEEIVYTDARADLMFCYGSPYVRRNAGPDDQTQLMQVSHLDAQRRYPVHITQQGQIDLIGVRFRPGGLAPFLPLPINETAGLTLGLSDVFGPSGGTLEYRLFDAAGNRGQQLILLNEFFVRRLDVRPAHTLVGHMAAEIDWRRGQVTIRELSRTYGYSVRAVDRLFQEVMGLSPKFYTRVVRLRHSLHALLQHPAIPWAELVGACGYYDQPHFIKEFEALTGLRPEEYRARVGRYRVAAPPNHVQFLQDRLQPEPLR
jgi:AraC-like DNA-binding protein